ncbi:MULTISPECIES: hypothetical protein [unclassified Corallococcus]|uniref:hypothetical protein n=1 Tax=unclassified Corallococcus TaxID=2685029 RepID=UPI001A8FD728|nr:MULTISPECIES: hypothetical protein [unclassified Corallococcus]MBN9683939.1 hypothetical protein [Corallococcus sp. NCSPR001]WAS84560.1 hypothetical protein O0N60_35490 [Corallococcus sp. NCRR]
MSPASTEPRPLLDALRAGTPLPAFPEADVARARRLADDVGAATPAAVEALPEALAGAVLEAAVLAGQVALPEALSASPVKPLAKAAKKALYRLRSRGVTPAEAPREAAPAPAPETLPTLVTVVSSAGQYGLLLTRVVRGGVELLQVIASDEQGVLELTRTEQSRGDIRRILKHGLKNGFGMEVSREEGARLLAEAAALNLRTRTPFPPDLEAALRHHGVHPQEPEPLPAPEPDDVRRALEGDQLHATPEMAEWMPPEEQMQSLMEQVQALASSPLALSGPQRQQQVRQKVLDAARAFFTPEVRQRYARRLWRMAAFFDATARALQADIARGEARRLFHGLDEPFSLFAETLFAKVVVLAAAGAQAQAAQGAPAPEAPPAAPTGERRSPGGLILP